MSQLKINNIHMYVTKLSTQPAPMNNFPRLWEHQRAMETDN